VAAAEPERRAQLRAARRARRRPLRRLQPQDYFNTAFCPKEEFSAPYHGLTVYSGSEDWPWGGKNSMYRFHVEDPIRFARSIRVTIETGHDNALGNDYSSTAYWYQRGDKQDLPPLPDVAARLPR
jgi:hypothetical protein